MRSPLHLLLQIRLDAYRCRASISDNENEDTVMYNNRQELKMSDNRSRSPWHNIKHGLTTLANIIQQVKFATKPSGIRAANNLKSEDFDHVKHNNERHTWWINLC